MLTLNDIVKSASGDILFFVDGDVILSENSLAVHIRNFADASIGATAGKYIVHTEEDDTLFHTENEYASLEQKIRESEGRISSTMGLYGGNYAIRKSLWKPLPSPLVHDDLFVILSVNDQGYRVIYEPESVSTDIYNRSLGEEFKRKARSASRGYHTLSYFPDALRFTKGADTFFLWSHKVLRWLSPMLILLTVLLLVFGYMTHGNDLYLALIAALFSGVLLAMVGYVLEQRGRTIHIMRQITWLVVMNLAYIYGTYQYVFGKDKPIWAMASRAIMPNDTNKE
jgi:cellulose synthase/poly-beta-1,6-N-acetylglucosamine synthase-like glycosyltransferase